MARSIRQWFEWWNSYEGLVRLIYTTEEFA